MGPPSYMRSVVDRKVVMRRMTVIRNAADWVQQRLRQHCVFLRDFTAKWKQVQYNFDYPAPDNPSVSTNRRGDDPRCLAGVGGKEHAFLITRCAVCN